MAFALSGAALSRLVVAHDCPDANVSDLSDLITNYQDRSAGEIESGLRWYYCGGLGIAILAMTGISTSHVHKEFASPRIAKVYRILYRVAVAVVTICLSLAHGLNSLQLIGTTAALVVSVLAIEIYGSSGAQTSFFGDSGGVVPTLKYTARCHVSENTGNGMEPNQTPDIEKLGHVP